MEKGRATANWLN